MASAVEQLGSDTKKVVPALCQAKIFCAWEILNYILGQFWDHCTMVGRQLPGTGGGESPFYVYCSRYPCSK